MWFFQLCMFIFSYKLRYGRAWGLGSCTKGPMGKVVGLLWKNLNTLKQVMGQFQADRAEKEKGRRLLKEQGTFGQHSIELEKKGPQTRDRDRETEMFLIKLVNDHCAQRQTVRSCIHGIGQMRNDHWEECREKKCNGASATA